MVLNNDIKFIKKSEIDIYLSRLFLLHVKSIDLNISRPVELIMKNLKQLFYFILTLFVKINSAEVYL